MGEFLSEEILPGHGSWCASRNQHELEVSRGGLFRAGDNDDIAQAITPFENMAKIALLHEMVHVKLHLADKDDAGEDHGEAFKAEIKRLTEAGAYDSLL